MRRINKLGISWSAIFCCVILAMMISPVMSSENVAENVAIENSVDADTEADLDTKVDADDTRRILFAKPNSEKVKQNPLANPPEKIVAKSPAKSSAKTAAKEKEQVIAAPVVNAPVKMIPPRAATPALPATKIAANSATTSTPAETNETYLLQSARAIGSTDLIETLLEASGEVRQVNENLQAVDSKIEVVAGFRYEERVTEFAPSKNASKENFSGANVSVRQYNLAKAKMKVGEVLKTPELDPQRRTIIARCDGDQITLFSPDGALKGEQFLLIEDQPGCTLVLDRLLPARRVRVGESWEITSNVLQAFLAIDAVTESNVSATLTAVADDLAMIELVGEVEGICLGAATEMSLKAKLQFDLETQRINWVGMVINENRSLSYVGPGMEIAARLQIKISPEIEPQSLVPERLEEISLTPNESLLQLAYSDGEGAWHFQYGRGWYLFQDNAQGTILRLLARGELVAQCSLADMGQVDPKRIVSLDKFSGDLAAGLSTSSAQIRAADAYDSEAGYKEYRVILDGQVEDLSLRWIYYLLTDRVGNQMVVVFVVEAGMLDTFGHADADFLETVRLGKHP